LFHPLYSFFSDRPSTKSLRNSLIKWFNQLRKCWVRVLWVQLTQISAKSSFLPKKLRRVSTHVNLLHRKKDALEDFMRLGAQDTDPFCTRLVHLGTRQYTSEQHSTTYLFCWKPQKSSSNTMRSVSVIASRWQSWSKEGEQPWTTGF